MKQKKNPSSASEHGNMAWGEFLINKKNMQMIRFAL
jgi:hypothetical protein